MDTQERPTFSQILDWLEGKLPEADAQAVARKLESADEETLADLKWLRAFLQTSQEIKLAAPPPAVRENLKSRFADYAGQRKHSNLIQRLGAFLTYDSLTHLATQGLRSAAAEGQQRQLVYQTEIAEIALNLQPRPNDRRLQILGQVFPAGDLMPGSFIVQILHEMQDVGLTTTDELGEFFFEGIPAGTYDLILIARHYEVQINSIPLQL